MRSVIRKPSIKKSFSARTTGKVKKSIKKTANPLYGKSGTGYIRNPQKAVYNKVYKKTSIGLDDIPHPKAKSSSYRHSSNSEYQEQTSDAYLRVTNSNLPQLVSEFPEIIEILHKNFTKKVIQGLVLLIIGITLFFFVPFIGIACIGIAAYLFYKSHKFSLAYNDAKRAYWDDKLNL